MSLPTRVILFGIVLLLLLLRLMTEEQPDVRYFCVDQTNSDELVPAADQRNTIKENENQGRRNFYAVRQHSYGVARTISLTSLRQFILECVKANRSKWNLFNLF